MPLEPKDITEKRLMALCNASWRLLQINKYLLEQLPPLKGSEPHNKFLERYKLREHLSKADEILQVYFLGD